MVEQVDQVDVSVDVSVEEKEALAKRNAELAKQRVKARKKSAQAEAENPQAAKNSVKSKFAERDGERA